MFYFYLMVVAVFVFDQVSKFCIIKFLEPGESISVIGNFFSLTLVFNKGVAFGLFNDKPYLVYILLILLGGCFIPLLNYLKEETLNSRIMAGLIFGGALGNIIDRIRLGAVIDFLDFKIWPVFNFADTAISVVAILFAIKILREDGYKKNK